MTKRAALFGGTFDPVHHGHLIAARSLAEQCGFEEITFVPARDRPGKLAPGASAQHRVAMLRLAIQKEELFTVSEVELRRGGPSFTYDTLMELRERQGPAVDLHWIIGTDMLADLPTWHRADEVVDLARIVIAARAPWHEQLGEIFGHLREHFTEEQVRRLQDSVVGTPLIDICSRLIRRRVAAGKSIRFLMPDSSISYIYDNGLYTASGTTEP